MDRPCSGCAVPSAAGRRQLLAPQRRGPQPTFRKRLTTACGRRFVRLPTKQRQAVAYHHVGGMPYAEVAALVGGSTDAARRAAHDAIRALRRRYRNSQPITLQKDSRS
jgi:hypothetical protein